MCLDMNIDYIVAAYWIKDQHFSLYVIRLSPSYAKMGLVSRTICTGKHLSQR